MNRLIKTYSPFLWLLYTAKAKQRKILIRSIDSSQLHALCEIILNIYRGNVPVTTYYIRKLLPLKSLIRKLIDRSVSNKTRIQLLLKNQKAIPQLLKPVLKPIKSHNE